MPYEWYERDPKSSGYKKGAAAAKAKAKSGQIDREQKEQAYNLLNKIESGQAPGRDDVVAPTQVVNALAQLENRPANTIKPAGAGATSPQDIAKAEANGWTWNGVPVMEKNGILVYDLDTIGAKMGMSADQIAKAKSVNFGSKDISTKATLEGLLAGGGQLQGNPAEVAAKQSWDAKMNSLSDSEAFINNLAQLDPVTANVDPNKKDHVANLYKPGFMSDFSGDVGERLNENQGPSGVGKYARYAVPALAALTIGAGALGAAGAFGSGATVTGAAGAGAAGAGAMTTAEATAMLGAGSGAGYGAAGAAGAAGAGAMGTAATGAGNALVTGGMGLAAPAAGAVASGIPWDAIITAGGAAASGAIAYTGAGKAADAVEDAAKEAADVQWKMYQQGREDLAPWREAGANALTDLTGRISGGPGEFEESPGYQFTLDQGLKAQQNALSAMGQNRSGKHLKSAAAYAEGLASTEYDNFLKRWYQSLTPYQSLAGLGQTSAGQTANLGAGTAANVGNAITQGGMAQGAGNINQANVLSGVITGGANELLRYNSLRNLPGGTTGQRVNVPTIRGGQGGGYGF